MKRIAGFVLAAAVSVFMFVSTGIAGDTITIGGDPCTVPLAEKLVEAFTKKSGIAINVASSSCSSGINKSVAGEVNIGVSTQNIDPKNLPVGATNIIIAKAPIVMVVNKANPVNNLSLSQLKDILSGKIKNWKEVGGKDMEIKNVMLQPCVTSTVAKQVTPYGSDIKKLTPEKKGNPVTNTNLLIEANEEAMGLQIYGYESPNVKVLTIDGYLPDEKTFPAKYGFYEDYNVITKGEPSGAVKDFINFALSPEGQRIVASMKHIQAKKSL